MQDEPLLSIETPTELQPKARKRHSWPSPHIAQWRKSMRPGAKQRRHWSQKGQRPDYRFSLANERTFLAWIRTALALVAGAVGLEQFASHLGSQLLRELLAVCLLLASGIMSGLAYSHWKTTERAMRFNADLPHNRMLLLISLFITGMALVLVLIFMWLQN